MSPWTFLLQPFEQFPCRTRPKLAGGPCLYDMHPRQWTDPVLQLGSWKRAWMQPWCIPNQKNKTLNKLLTRVLSFCLFFVLDSRISSVHPLVSRQPDRVFSMPPGIQPSWVRKDESRHLHLQHDHQRRSWSETAYGSGEGKSFWHK